MAGNKKSLLASLIKDLVGNKASGSSKENDERKKELIKETIKESVATGGGNASDDAAMMRILNMLETQLNVKTSALEEEASKRRDAELEVQKLQQQLIKLESDQKREESDKTLNTIMQLVDALSTESASDKKEKAQPKGSKDYHKQNENPRGGKGKPFSRPNSKEGNNNENYGNKSNFDANLNNPEQSKMNKCQNKLLNDQQFSQFNNTNFNKNMHPANFNSPPLMSHSNNFNQGNQGPMHNFNPNKPPPLLDLPFPNQNMNQPFPNQNMHQSFPNQNVFQQPNLFHQQPNNFSPCNQFNQPNPHTGLNIPPTGPNQFQTFPNQGDNQQQFHHARGRGGYNWGRGNVRGNFRGGNFRGGMNPRGGKQFGGNYSHPNNDKMQDGFVVVSKPDVRGPYKNNTRANQMQDGKAPNIQKTNFKKKRNRNRPQKQDNKGENKEKDKDNDFDTESVMQGMIDIFSKMFGSASSSETTKPKSDPLPQQPPKPKNQTPQQPAKPKNQTPQQPPKPKNQTPQQPPKPKNQTPQQPPKPKNSVEHTGAIKKDLPEKPQNKANKKKDGKKNPLKLFVGSGFPSEEEAEAKNIDLNQEVKDIIMVAKHEGRNVTEQPKTLLDMTNFRKKYSNASAIVVKDEH